MKKITLRLAGLFILIFCFVACSQDFKKDLQATQKTEWLVASLLKKKSEDVQIHGDPQLVDSPYGQAVYFDGISEGLFLSEMPLKSLERFTVEMIFYPETDSPFEQRMLHIGDVSKDRMLLEIRAVDNHWYFDGFVASGVNSKALIDPQLTHSLGEWHHLALVVNGDSLTTFVNGIQELSAPLKFDPITIGQSSIGVRQNKVSWFKGKIYKIQISPKPLKPQDFMAY